MAKPNYKFDKRQRDIAKKKQQDEKLLKKRAKSDARIGDDAALVTPAPDATPGAATKSADA
jgi:hypothetical protein